MSGPESASAGRGCKLAPRRPAKAPANFARFLAQCNSDVVFPADVVGGTPNPVALSELKFFDWAVR